jgi:hypothetical protein
MFCRVEYNPSAGFGHGTDVHQGAVHVKADLPDPTPGHRSPLAPIPLRRRVAIQHAYISL